jgi:hypothetical protein
MMTDAPNTALEPTATAAGFRTLTGSWARWLHLKASSQWLWLSLDR